MTKAIRVHNTGGPEVMTLEDVEVGRPGVGEVRVRHTAIGLNFIDVYFRTGAYPAQTPFTPGFEAAGETFLADMKAAGLTVVPAAEAFAEPLPLQELGANNAPMAAATAPAVAASGAG